MHKEYTEGGEDNDRQQSDSHARAHECFHHYG